MREAAKGETADLCLVNTCSVTEVADHKCRQAIHRMIRSNPGAFVVVTGCYAQLKPEHISAMDGVDLVLGANEKANLISILPSVGALLVMLPTVICTSIIQSRQRI